MNSATLSNRPTTANLSNAGNGGNALKQFWYATQLTFGAIFSMRHQLQQFDEVQRLLRESRALETSNPKRSDALRAKAFELLD